MSNNGMFTPFSRNEFYDNTFLQRLRKDIQRVEGDAHKSGKTSSQHNNRNRSKSKETDAEKGLNKRDPAGAATMVLPFISPSTEQPTRPKTLSREKSNLMLKASLQKKTPFPKATPTELPLLTVVKKPVTPVIPHKAPPTRGDNSIRRSRKDQYFDQAASSHQLTKNIVRLPQQPQRSQTKEYDRLVVSPSISLHRARSVSESVISGEDFSELKITGERMTPVLSPHSTPGNSPHRGRKLSNVSSYTLTTEEYTAEYVNNLGIKPSPFKKSRENRYTHQQRHYTHIERSVSRSPNRSKNQDARKDLPVYTPMAIPAALHERSVSRRSVNARSVSPAASLADIDTVVPGTILVRQSTQVREIAIQTEELPQLSNQRESVFHYIHAAGPKGKKLTSKQIKDKSKAAALPKIVPSQLQQAPRVSVVQPPEVTTKEGRGNYIVDNENISKSFKAVIGMKTLTNVVPSGQRYKDIYAEHVSAYSRESTIHIDIAISHDEYSDALVVEPPKSSFTTTHDTFLPIPPPSRMKSMQDSNRQRVSSRNSNGSSIDIPEIRMICATP